MVDVTQVCPICSGRELLSGFNDLGITHPKLAKEFSPKNEQIVSQIRAGETVDLIWSGECGHEWVMDLKARIAGQNCPYCAGARILVGFNDFASNYPQYIKHWSPKNKILPTEISKHSNKLVLFVCDNNHELLESPKTWVSRQCNICSGRKLLPGFNDIFSVAPHLEQEWDASNEVDPKTIKFNNRDLEVLWNCSRCGHKWVSGVRGRVRGSSCPSCAVATSNWEDAVEKVIKAHYDGVILRRQKKLRAPDGKLLELDFLMPSISLAIEVQDFTTHSRDSDTEISTYRTRKKKSYKKGPTYHELKRTLAREQLNVDLVDIWEDTILEGTDAVLQEIRKIQATFGKDKAIASSNAEQRSKTAVHTP